MPKRKTRKEYAAQALREQEMIAIIKAGWIQRCADNPELLLDNQNPDLTFRQISP